MKKNLIVTLLVALFTCGICSSALSKTHSGIITVEVDLSVQAQGQTARLLIPYPVSDRDQLISDIQTSGDYSANGVYTDRSYGTPILYAEWPKDATSRKLKFSFKVERQEVRRRALPAQKPTWNPADYAEFFLPGYGWVPVDPADVRKKMLVEKLDLKDAKTNAYRDYFWGGIDPYRVVIAHGRDLVLNPPQKGSPLNTFGYPYAEVGGHPIDFYDPAAFIYRITYHEK